MIEPYELTEQQIFAWADSYAGYDELERVAKGLYGLYVQRRKHEQPASHKRNSQQAKQTKH